MMKDYALNEVKIVSGDFANAREVDLKFIRKLEPDRLLSGFRRSAGLDDKGYAPYGGWEDTRIGGHTMGHYLVACAQEVQATGDADLTKKVAYIVEELEKCQNAHGNGFLFGAALDEKEYPEQQFDGEEGKIEATTWVPWYTLHKIFDGLIAVYRLCHMEKALTVVSKLGDWVWNRASEWSEETRKHVLTKEYGGMNDCLYQLYEITGRENHKKAAQKFDDSAFMERVVSDKPDTLHKIHANTTIPKFLGGMVEHGEKSEIFWDKVVERHSYATGGISDMEHFGADYTLDSRRTQCNCESCCAHNMLKLSHRLWKRQQDKKYVDYSERLLFNAILGAIHPEEGTTTYFCPMGTGYSKTFSHANPDENLFWCCTGTGMENYTKVQEEIYFKEDNVLWVNQYLPSQLKTDDIAVTQEVELAEEMKVTIHVVTEKPIQLKLRVPAWVKNREEEYICVAVDKECNHTISFPLEVRVETLPDNEDVVCFAYGPYVLAAKLDKEEVDVKTGAGIDVFATEKKKVGAQWASPKVVYGESHVEVLENEYLSPVEGTREEFLNNISKHLKKVQGKELEFVLTGTDAEEKLGQPLVFVPYYKIVEERFGIYWYVK